MINSKVCPDIMFAKSLIDKLKTLETKERNSIIIKKGKSAFGAPDGFKTFKKEIPCKKKPKKTFPKKILLAKESVTLIWLV